MQQLSRSRHARCCCWESVNCSANLVWNYSHTSSMLSTAGSKESTHCPISHAHPATSLPLIIVSVIETLCIGDSNPVMPLFAWKYLSTLSMNSWALAWLPVNIWGNVPMVLMSLGAAAGTGPWAVVAGIGPAPPPPGAPPSGDPPPPPPPPLLGPPDLRIAVCSLS